jgi:hypothetical protein
MLSERIEFVICAVLLSTSWITCGAQNTEVQRVPPQTASEPDPASRLADLPPGPVIVNYQQGQLMIEAQNATLSTVLRAACNQTGTAIDIPPDAEERVVGVFGPGPARDVFALLLNGSRFNYIILGSTDDAARVVRLTLSLRPISVRSVAPHETPSAHPAPQAVAKADVPPPQLPPQAQKPSAEPSTPDHSVLKELRRRHRR